MDYYIDNYVDAYNIRHVGNGCCADYFVYYQNIYFHDHDDANNQVTLNSPSNT